MLVITWKALRTLTLFSVGLDDETVANLLSGFPALGTSELLFVNGFRKRKIRPSNLKKLKL